MVTPAKGLRSVHNIRIERLWVDVTAKVGRPWATRFRTLEERVGLDINNVNHLWLLHHLFLGAVNTQLIAFRDAWNSHEMRLTSQPSRSPNDLFFFGMISEGERGDPLFEELDTNGPQFLPEDDDVDPETYGVDWEALNQGVSRHPETVNEVALDSPSSIVHNELISALNEHLSRIDHSFIEQHVLELWFEALTFLQSRVAGF